MRPRSATEGTASLFALRRPERGGTASSQRSARLSLVGALRRGRVLGANQVVYTLLIRLVYVEANPLVIITTTD